MTLSVALIARAFNYNGIKLNDPSEAMTPDQVREFFATQYPELNNAVVEGPVTKNNVSTFTFQRAAGAKGRGAVCSELRTKVMEMASGIQNGAQLMQPIVAMSDSMKQKVQSIESVASSKRVGRPMPLPSQAHGIWG